METMKLEHVFYRGMVIDNGLNLTYIISLTFIESDELR